MSRNSSGTYTLPESAYVSGTTITSSSMNNNLSDIATALTQSLATTGVSSMTGPIKAAAGSLVAPSITLASDPTTGWYNSTTGTFTYVASGSAVASFGPGLVAFATAMTGTSAIFSGAFTAASLSVSGAITLGATTLTTTGTPLTLQCTTNDAAEHTLTTFELGSAVGVKASLVGLGTGNNDLTILRYYFDAIRSIQLSGTGNASYTNFRVSATAAINLYTAGYQDLPEIGASATATVSSPSAGNLRIYVKQNTVDQLFAQNSAGLEINLMDPPATAYQEYTANTLISSAIPADNSIPQIGEGVQILNPSFTPKRGLTSRIRVEVQGQGVISGANLWTMALYKDGASNAVRAATVDSGNASLPSQVTIVYEFAPASVNAIAFTVRVGPNTGGSMRMNGNALGSLNGVPATTITITELYQ